ncbi:MAG: right-handed parallel beta-helix repeat-containing protein [Pseudomonadota bacterium]
MTRVRLPLVVLCLFAWSCGPPPQSLSIRPDYTSPGAIAAFGTRDGLLAGKSPGRITVSTLDGVEFTSIQAAISRAPSGSEISIPAGRYDEPILIEDKNLRLVGAGADATAIVAAQTALWVSGGNVEIQDLTLASRSVAESTAVAALTDTATRLVGCRVIGGTGPGILVTGTSDVHLEGNLVTGNMGGGLLIKGGRVTSFRNTLAANAVAGYVFSPTSHTSILGVLGDHDTVLDNWSGPRCVAMSRKGLIPPEVLASLVRIRSSILNSGGVGETLGIEAVGGLRRGGLNFLSDEPLPAPTFFTAPTRGDYTPVKEIAVKDRNGIEVGAIPSREYGEHLAGLAQGNLLEGKVWRAYLLSRFLPRNDRVRIEDAVQKTIYEQTGDALAKDRVGPFLHNVLALVEHVPPTWRLDALAGRLAEAFAAAHRTKVQFFDLFPGASPVFQKSLTERITAGLPSLPAVLTLQGNDARKLMLSGAFIEPTKEHQSSSKLQVIETIQNTWILKLNDKIAYLRNRTEGQAKKVKELDATVNNPHLFPPGKESKRQAILLEMLEKVRKEQAVDEADLARLVETRDAAPPTYVAEITGTLTHRTLQGAARVSVIGAPSGDILLDTPISLNHVDQWLQVEPLPTFGFLGMAQAPPKGDVDALLADLVAGAYIEGLAQSLVKELEVQVSRWERGLNDEKVRELLVELVYLHAPMFARARIERPRYEALLKQLTAADGGSPVRVEMGYDPDRGPAEQGVTLKVTPAPPRARLEADKARLETLYLPYWTLEPRLKTVLWDLLGTDLEEIIRYRKTLDRFMGM